MTNQTDIFCDTSYNYDEIEALFTQSAAQTFDESFKNFLSIKNNNKYNIQIFEYKIDDKHSVIIKLKQKTIDVWFLQIITNLSKFERFNYTKPKLVLRSNIRSTIYELVCMLKEYNKFRAAKITKQFDNAEEVLKIESPNVISEFVMNVLRSNMKYSLTDTNDTNNQASNNQNEQNSLTNSNDTNKQQNETDSTNQTDTLTSTNNQNKYTLSHPISNPLVLKHFTQTTEIQDKVIQHVELLPLYGMYSYSCSCGSGKTIAGIYCIHKLQCKTLIISSRTAVNDQWFHEITTLYPSLIIKTRKGVFCNNKRLRITKNKPEPEIDIWIYTPQYIVDKIDQFNVHPKLIIYDEVHSLLAEKFINVLLYSMHHMYRDYKTNDRMRINELPYMIALSATYPPQKSKAYKSLTKIFGTTIRTKSNITDIPVYVYDYRDHYKCNDIVKIDDLVNDKVITTNAIMDNKHLGICDKRYNPPNSNEVLIEFCNMIDDSVYIDPTSTKYKGIIMTDEINESIYAALYVYCRWNCSVLLMRAVDEPVIYLEKDRWIDMLKYDLNELNESNELNVSNDCNVNDTVDMNNNINNTTNTIQTTNTPKSSNTKHTKSTRNTNKNNEILRPQYQNITFENLLKQDIGIKLKSDDYFDVIDSTSIIVGTIIRLKEGFSIQNITWGICTQFLYSSIARVQILGRIRRSSNDPELNERKRIMLVCSKKITSLYDRKRHTNICVKYDINAETANFEFENYKRF